MAPETRILYDDGRRIIVKDTPGLADTLAEMGFALKLMSETPMVLAPTAPESGAKELMEFTPDPLVSQMIGNVSPDVVNSYISGLSGESMVTVEGAPYTITTRYTKSGIPLQKATQYVFEQLQNMGLITTFQDWAHASYGGRNVVGELRGAGLPEEIVLLTAHLDNLPNFGTAPGADDNASGSAGLLTAAGIMSRYRFQRTIRFVFFTGEEQGLLGSAKYAATEASQKIVAVLNMDMIAYNTEIAKTQRLHTRSPANPGYPADLSIANTFVDVVNSYGIAGSLQPTISSDGETASDHSSFWDKGFGAILVIENDDQNFNPYYHTSSDKLQYLNVGYCTAQVKASVGTGAHLARPLPRPLPLPKFVPSPWLLLLGH
jgi:acetylornithine deacetylase/succinyl-diaminopimelate desuccinylase-like protein